MTDRISTLVDKISKLEKQLRDEIKEQEDRFQYRLEGRRVKFEQSVLEAHRKFKVAILPWLRASLWRNVFSAPFIYAMIVPLAFLDLTVTLYQQLCFRLYDIQRVDRSRYVILDRHQLAYLNGIEKFNCIYCGYGNGIIAYAREIIARTEQYWCPIKHARQALGTHRRYDKFANYGDADNYKPQLLKLRDELRSED
ncbi:MAG: hypothetical protein PsegKO_20140 [Pseudohongiellaceae bacterium]